MMSNLNNILKGKWKMIIRDSDKRIENMILIPVEEYKELLIIKGKYMEIKEKNTIRVTKDGIEIPYK